MMGGSGRVRRGARRGPRDARGESEYKSERRKRKPLRWRKVKYLIETFGCQMNQHDSERMAGLLEQAGYDRTDDDRDADVIVINTCSVREKAEEKLYTRLGEIRMMGDETGSRPVVAVAGCVAQQEGETLLQDERSRHRRLDWHPEPQEAADARRTRHELRPRIAHCASRLASISNPYDDVSFPLGIAQRDDPHRGLRHDHRRLQRVLRLLRRPLHPRQRADAAGRRHRRRGPSGGRHRGPRGPAARADRQPLPGAGRPRLRLRGTAVARQRGRRGSSGSASRARIRGT